ncbi:MAG: hypothetical protein WCO66_02540 [Candidatus Absconditabacteria bacterium]
MVKNLINFATVNPWTSVLTGLSIILFICIIFLINGKKDIMGDAKLTKIPATIFMLLMLALVLGVVAAVALEPSLAKIIDQNVFFYWIGMFGLWGIVKHMTGIDPQEIFDEVN